MTVKMRLGWDDGSINAPEIAAPGRGGRRARWSRCTAGPAASSTTAPPTGRRSRAVKAAVAIPVIVNGDIVDAADGARGRWRCSGADGVMVGRGARGRPWLLGEIAAGARRAAGAGAPRGAALATLVCGHYEAMLGFYGRDLGVRVARKHLGWYLDGVAGARGRCAPG